MPVINYKRTKTEVPARNFDTKTLTDDYDIALQDASGNYGVKSFFGGIRDFFKGVAARTLTATSRITVTDANGNVTYTTPNAIKDTLNLATNNDISNIISVKNYTISFNGDGAAAIPQTVYNTNVIKIGDIHLCSFELLLGEITESKVAYLTISSLNTNNYRCIGEMSLYNGYNYNINSLGNKTAWLWKDGVRVRTDIFSGKRIRGFIIFYPYTSPESASTLSIE